MSIGSVLLPLYLGALFGYAALWLRERLRRSGAPVWLAWLTRGGWSGRRWLLGSGSFSEAIRLFQQFGYWKLLFVGSSLGGLLLLTGTLRSLSHPQWLSRSWWLGALALLSAWSFRWAVLMDVQTVPKYGAGLYPYELPLGGDGLLGIVGTFGL